MQLITQGLGPQHLIVAVLAVAALLLVVFLRNVPRRRADWAEGHGERHLPDGVSAQLHAIQTAKLAARKPINASAYQVLVALEKEISNLAPRSRVLAEVGLGSFITTSGDLGKTAFRAIAAKRADFLVIDHLGNPAFAVEYHGSGHHMSDTAAARDAIKKEALRRAGIELVEIYAHSGTDERSALIRGAIQRNCQRDSSKFA